MGVNKQVSYRTCIPKTLYTEDTKIDGYLLASDLKMYTGTGLVLVTFYSYRALTSRHNCTKGAQSTLKLEGGRGELSPFRRNCRGGRILFVVVVLSVSTEQRQQQTNKNNKKTPKKNKTKKKSAIAAVATKRQTKTNNNNNNNKNPTYIVFANLRLIAPRRRINYLLL